MAKQQFPNSPSWAASPPALLQCRLHFTEMVLSHLAAKCALSPINVTQMLITSPGVLPAPRSCSSNKISRISNFNFKLFQGCLVSDGLQWTARVCATLQHRRVVSGCWYTRFLFCPGAFSLSPTKWLLIAAGGLSHCLRLMAETALGMLRGARMLTMPQRRR